MSLVYCPECDHEVSANAAACPNCGFPINPATPPVVERRVVVTPPSDGFPPWAFVPIGIAALVLIVVLFVLFRNSDDTGNTNLRATTNRADTRTGSVPSTSTSIPSTSGPSTVTMPATSQSVPSTATSEPIAPPEKGRVVLTAKVQPATGAAAAAKGTRFYLLDKDLNEILSSANVEPIEGNSLEASLGLATVDPGKYGDFMKAAMKAIGNHAKYSATTDGTGNASFAGVSPDSYYLFAITKAGRGFAMWNAPVAVSAGDNNLNISPQGITEISAGVN